MRDGVRMCEERRPDVIQQERKPRTGRSPATECKDCHILLTPENKQPLCAQCRTCFAAMKAKDNLRKYHDKHPQARFYGSTGPRPKPPEPPVLDPVYYYDPEPREGVSGLGEKWGGLPAEPFRTPGGTCPHCHLYQPDLRRHVRKEHG